MKRFVAVLSGLLVMPAFAEVAPIYYDDMIEYSDVEMFDEDVPVEEDVVVEDVVTPVMPVAPVAQMRSSSRSTSTRASRAVPQTATTRTSSVAPSRAVASRAAANISQTRNAMTRGTASRAAVTRAATNSQNVSARRAAQIAAPVVAARAGAVTTSITQTDTVNTPLYTGRVAMRNTSSARSRVPAVRVAGTTSTVAATPVTVEEVKTSMDELAQITDFCKAQYTDCMDNFCNVLDDNQGRCSCSKNIKNYAKTEEALKLATEKLQDVAQKIQYIGLTGDEVETLFAQTAAEEAMQSNSDSSQIKSDLDKIKNMIVDVKTGTSSSSEVTSGLNFDLSGLLDFSIDSTGFDLTAMFGGGNAANTASISNQRGEELYKTASSRCKVAVLNDCAAQGVDISVITNSYDLEIDKQCVAYERSLTDANDQMASTVRNAQTVLQKARLMVAQQKNAYDLRGCVNALDSCMQDDFVCGTDYENCLDPTGKYIVNGAVVVGSEPGAVISDKTPLNVPNRGEGMLYSTWNYGQGSCKASDTLNAWEIQTSESGLTQQTNLKHGTLSGYVNACMATSMPISTDLDQMARFLQAKIGYNADGKNFGMCISVLNKCQNYTYNDSGEYKPDNAVIREYLMRTLTQIKVAQDDVIADYAENCLADVQSCLTQNNYANDPARVNVAVNACKAVLKTCYSVNGRVFGNASDALKMFAVSIMGCEDGEFFSPVKGKCTPNCAEGEGWSEKDGICKKCGDNETFNAMTGECESTKQ